MSLSVIPPATVQRPRIRWVGVLAGAAVLLSLSCFEDPVSESVELKMLPDDLVQVTTVVTITPQDNKDAGERLARLREEMESGHDAWSRRFEGLDPATESIEWQKQAGLLRVMRRSAVIQTDDLKRFFSDTSISVGTVRGQGWRELSLYAGVSNRASKDQQHFVNAALDQWSQTAAAYVSAMDATFRYLHDNPDRVNPVLGRLFSDVLSEEELSSLAEIRTDEKKMIDKVEAEQSELAGMFQVRPGEAFSLNELTELVYDPFPGSVSLTFPGAVIESSGFVKSKNGALMVPRTSLWSALQSLQSRWVSPDPLTLQVSKAREGIEGPVSLQSILDVPRQSRSDLSAAEIRKALEGQLRVPDQFRVRWVDAGLER